MPLPDDALLDQARQQADPPADEAIARLLGATQQDRLGGLGSDWRTQIDWVNQAIGSWQTNADVADWRPDPRLPQPVVDALQAYLQRCQALPDWADAEKIRRAEALFFEEGVLSCLLLFCASLPECYVVPDLAEVLQATAQLKDRTEHRVRATAAMIFPVMMKGGLTSPGGSGRAQVLKVRLIHATVRHLLLRSDPEQAPGQVAALAPALLQQAGGGLHASLYAHGWDRERDGLPCNQEELGYTLLTFGYVMLRSLRRLGVGHRPADEQAILHTWNVMGHLVGVRTELIPADMDEAQQLFARLQARGLQQRLQPDPRPPLTAALMDCMAAVLPWPVFKPMPALLTRYLLGRRNAGAIGLTAAAPLRSRLLFWGLLLGARLIDSIGQWVVRGFSISRLLGRLIGYRLLTKLLMDQTRPLRLPDTAQRQMALTVAGWGRDPQAPDWINALEDRFTTQGEWAVPPPAAQQQASDAQNPA